MKFTLTIAVFALFALLFTGCNGRGDVAGSGSQTTNGVTVAVQSGTITVSGKAGLKVMVYSNDYLPYNDSLFADTNLINDNQCTFNALPADSYTVLIADSAQELSAIFQNIRVDESSHSSYTDTLGSGGSVSGKIRLEGQPTPNAIAYIKGTPFFTESNDSGRYAFPSLPFGDYDIAVEFTQTLYIGSMTIVMETPVIAGHFGPSITPDEPDDVYDMNFMYIPDDSGTQ